MKWIRVSIIFLIFVLFFCSLPARAFEISSDPQYVVINFSDTFHFLDWTASDKDWQQKVKPVAIQRLRRLKTLLTTGTENRRLAWSTLMEYMNYPMDKPSTNSPYVVRLKRMMELAEAENLPIYVPLNGVQWWDELPNLWNYWDYDGNQTSGCTNDNYANCPFAKLKNPEYRKRFIKGYNLNNKYNVDWSDWKTPMGFSVRNWGGDDVYVAPSPNLVNDLRAPLSFRTYQKQRYTILVQTILDTVNRWQKEGKGDLFAGITIGTEVTLNSTVGRGDAAFQPFGYRAMQDEFCPKNNLDCGSDQNWTYQDLETMREKVLNDYFTDFAGTAIRLGLPKQRIYSHVWNEAEPGELKYIDAFGASITVYSRPGQSLYGKATNPFGFSVLANDLKKNGYPAWAAPEFAPLTRDDYNWSIALDRTLNDPTDPAKVIDVYNETDILNTPAIPQLKLYLSERPIPSSCAVSETIPLTPTDVINPKTISWRVLDQKDNADKVELTIWKKNTIPTSFDLKVTSYKLQATSKYDVSTSLNAGFYYWSVKRTGCDGTKWTESTPRFFYVSLKLPEVKLKRWIDQLL